MFLSRMLRFHLSGLVALTAAAAALLLAAGPASAQAPWGSKLWPWNVQGASPMPAVPRTSAPASSPSSSAQRTTSFNSVRVVVTRAATVSAPAPESVTLRGPDGVVRTFPLEGGREAIVVREVTLRPGESVTINVNPSASPQTQGR
jgi:hypothetical protein